ncbi:MAG: aminoacyl-tRNA hydrolase [Bacteroidetes bacterium HGW-Bacteroidetes-4]|jgi:ribosome-associated protein|nr:MAG: aminoacyl-tRNA hydrolase [Bacteroidetes bacterium HGW-Bacteroidetes-4]
MELSAEQKEQLLNELVFTSSRSSGPGGQHVNKVNTKIELRFRIVDSQVLKPEQKIILFKKLGKKLTLEGELLITAKNDRSQLQNKQAAISRFFETLDKALKPRKRRIPTKPSITSIKKRIESNKILSIKKSLRKKPNSEN